MTDRIKIAFAQMNQRMGDLDANASAMLEMRRQAKDADLLLCPELQLTGYPPEDLMLKPEFVRRTMECTEGLIEATVEPGPAILFGTAIAEGGSTYNAVVLANGGKVLGRTLKRELPNYGTFDEKRIFMPGPMPEPIEFNGVKIGVPICEDIWQDVVCAHLAEAGAEILLVPNGSPYELDKDETRQHLVRSRALSSGLPIAYVNRVGGQDELAFDGSSFVMHPDGELVVQTADWDEGLLITDWKEPMAGAAKPAASVDRSRQVSGRCWLRPRLCGRNGFRRILGLSGGSIVLSAVVAVDALGGQGVGCDLLKVQAESLDDARECRCWNAAMTSSRRSGGQCVDEMPPVDRPRPENVRRASGWLPCGAVQCRRTDAPHHRKKSEMRWICNSTATWPAAIRS
jgi:NAD+ synthase